MRTVRLLVLGALALLLSSAARARGDELPASAKRIIEETDRDIQEIEKKTEAAVTATRDATQILCGYGFIDETPVTNCMWKVSLIGVRPPC